MIPRSLLEQIKTDLLQFPVVGLVGPRQSGKTTLARQVVSGVGSDAVYLDLELPSDQAKLAEPELFLGQYHDRLIILDEVQYIPQLFSVMRGLIDQDRRPGRFLILGSASPVLLRQSSESLAGRIIYRTLEPLTTVETGSSTEEWQRLWLRGGFPDSYLASTEDQSLRWRLAYLQSFVERDLPQLGLSISSQQLWRFLSMLAHSHAQQLNISKIASSLGVSAPTVRRYIDILEETFLVRELTPFHANLKKRLVKSSKLYFRDSGLLHGLLGIRGYEDLLGHPAVGGSWEGFVIEQIIRSRPEFMTCHFFRTSAGAEIDLVLLPPGRPPVAIEVKHSASPRSTRSFTIAFADLGCRHGWVVYPGDEIIPLAENVSALPLSRLGEIWKTD